MLESSEKSEVNFGFKQIIEALTNLFYIKKAALKNAMSV